VMHDEMGNIQKQALSQLPIQLTEQPMVSSLLSALLGAPTSRQPTIKQESVASMPPSSSQLAPAPSDAVTLSCETKTASAIALPTIFIALPAYRDSELLPTIRHLFTQSRHPSRIYLGVCMQYEMLGTCGRTDGGAGVSSTHVTSDSVMHEEDSHPTDPSPSERHMLYKHMGWSQLWNDLHALDATGALERHIKVIATDAKDAAGPVWARHLACSLFMGQDYVLHIDSHMRFVRHWDELLIQQLLAAEVLEGSSKVILTTYPPGYELHEGKARLPTPNALDVALASLSHHLSKESILLPECLLPVVMQPSVPSIGPDGFPRYTGERVRARDRSSLEAARNKLRGASASASSCSQAVPSITDLLGTAGLQDLLPPEQVPIHTPTEACPLEAFSAPEFPPISTVKYFAAGFAFSRSAFLLSVPPLPSLRHLFFGEEATTMARARTLGYVTYAPGISLVFHLWSRAHRPLPLPRDAWAEQERHTAIKQAKNILRDNGFIYE
jgi:hypothetical protein